MVFVALIIGSLALVAATVSVVLTVREQKRSQERNAAYVETMRTVVQEHRTALENFLMKELKKLELHTEQQVKDMRKNAEQTISDVQKNVQETMGNMCKRLSDLEGGVIPDYEKAKQAAKAVNDFSAGISGILGFDPMDALRQSREQEGDN